jgi:hypothetical protein
LRERVSRRVGKRVEEREGVFVGSWRGFGFGGTTYVKRGL